MMIRLEHNKAAESDLKILNGTVVACLFFLLGLLTMIKIDSHIIEDLHAENAKLKQAVKTVRCERINPIPEIASK
jgi:hypothetical protein